MKKNNNKEKIIAILKFAILILIVVGIPLYIYFFHADLLKSFSSLNDVKVYFDNNLFTIILGYILLQCMQIVICMIPGQWLQIAIGYFYGIPVGYILSLIGALLGSIITYYLAGYLGHDAMHLFFGEDKIKEILKKLNSKKAMIIIFLIFLIPGVPKDMCNYAAGLSEMKLKPFLIVSLAGRTPGMLGSIIIGRQLYLKSYGIAIVVGIVAVIFFIIGIIFREKFNKLISKFYDKYIGE